MVKRKKSPRGYDFREKLEELLTKRHLMLERAGSSLKIDVCEFYDKSFKGFEIDVFLKALRDYSNNTGKIDLEGRMIKFTSKWK
jgi:hypothetical protein